MKSIEEIQERIDYNNEMILDFRSIITKEMAKEIKDNDFIYHCRDRIKEINTDTKALLWVINLPTK